jgi:hypothetical protein
MSGVSSQKSPSGINPASPAVADMRDYFTSGYFQGCQERLRTMRDILVGPGADVFSAQGQQG